ncbi:hypothetical protein [Kitasatospora sp. NPDC085879]|uniref:hypothetical protein n=1 Tax=Kitasatospora sp. NPDC085879 TaxID=3154769 RepID=UPI003449FB0D
MREQILARQKQMGLVPENTELPPLNPIGTPETRTGPGGEPFPALDFTRPWAELGADERRLFARMAEAYAGVSPGVATGVLSLYHGDRKVGERRIRTQPGRFTLAGEGLVVGRDSGEPVSDLYPGTSPWAFTGGVLHRVAVDVSGEPYIDLEAEAQAMLARE